jgi:hypothetical protein
MKTIIAKLKSLLGVAPFLALSSRAWGKGALGLLNNSLENLFKWGKIQPQRDSLILFL